MQKKVFERPQISDITQKHNKNNTFHNEYFLLTNLIHFRDTKLLRVGLKFTNVSFARVRQIYDNAKIEGWGEGGYIRKVRMQGRGVP